MISTRKLIILFLLPGAQAWAQSTGALDYSGRLFDAVGEPYSGAVSVRADVKAGSCVLYRRLQMAGAADEIVADTDGNFKVTIQTGVSSVDSGEFESTTLQGLLNSTQITPINCFVSGTFVPNSSAVRTIEIAISLDNGTTWEVVDEQELRPYHQSFDTTAFGGFALADFVYDNGDGKITRAKVETLLSSTYSGVLTGIVADGTLSLSSMDVASVGTGTTAVVNRGYVDASLAGADAADLQGLSAGQANEVVIWDGSKWTTGTAPNDPTKLSLTGGTMSGNLTFSGSSANLVLLNQASIAMGTTGFYYLPRHPVAPNMVPANAGAFWFNVPSNEISYYTGSGTLGILTTASTLAIGNFGGTLGVSRGGTGLGSYTGGALLAANSTGSAIQNFICGATQVPIWTVTGWACQNAASGTAGDLQFYAGGTLGSSSHLTWANGTLAVGVADAIANLHVAGKSVVFEAFSGDSPSVDLVSNPNVEGANASSILSGANLGHLGFGGFAAGDRRSPGTGISSTATQNWGAAAQGSDLSFWTTANGSATASERMRLHANGNLRVGGAGAAVHPLDVTGIIGSRPEGSSTGEAGALRLYELAAGGSQSVTLRAPDSIGTDVEFILPVTDGSAGQILRTNGAGQLSFVDVGAGLGVPGSSGDLVMNSNGTLAASSVHWRPGYGLGINTTAASSALHVVGGGIPFVLQDSDGGGRYQQFLDNGGTALGEIGADTSRSFLVWAKNATSDPALEVDYDGRISIGLTADPASDILLNVKDESTDPTVGTNAARVRNLVTMTAASAQNIHGMTVLASETINGPTVTGTLSGAQIQALVEGTSGSLSQVNAVQALARTTGAITITDLAGVRVDSNLSAATITRLYGVLITPPTGSATVNEEYGVYQQSPTARNFFAGSLGIGTVSPGALLDVAGAVRMGDTAATCSAAREGSQRYNSTSKIMEFCDGTSWLPLSGGLRSCPTGFSLIGTAGTHSAFCIHSSELTAASFDVAISACSVITDSRLGRAHLCSMTEWFEACSHGSGLTGITGNAEWVADGSDVGGTLYGMTTGTSSCGSRSFQMATNGNPYRCCFQ